MWHKLRRAAILLQVIVIIGLPFVKINGESAFRFDLVNFKLHFFGSVVWLEEFYLFLIASLFILMLIGLLTVVLGRVWCGWLCPQTILLDISNIIAQWFTKSKKKKKIIQNIVLLIMSGIVSLSLIWYFVPPFETMASLSSSNVILGFFIVDWVIIYAELAYLGRDFCKTICPYSMLQNAIFDKDTVVVSYDITRDKECLQCDLCVKVCTVGINIKEGLQKECVACAECIDACASMTKPKNMLPFIRYKGNVRRAKTYILGGVTAIFLTILIILSTLGSDTDFYIIRNYYQPTKSMNLYSYTITNSRSNPINFILSVKEPFTLLGNSKIIVSPYSKKKGVAIIKANGNSDKVIFTLKGDNVYYEREDVYQ